MNSKIFLSCAALVLTLFLSACVHDQKLADEETPAPNEETSEEAYKTPEDTEQKLKKAMDIVHAMEENGMNEIENLFSNLKKVKTVSKSSSENIAEMGTETWLYSEEYNVTVVSCNAMNTPSHVFKGKTLSASEIAEVKKMMKEMMDMMNNDEVDEKLKKAEDIVHAMAEDGMNDIIELFPNLSEVRVVEKDDPANIAGMGSETWLYSQEYDVTVVRCNAMNTPSHVFKGKTLSQQEIDAVKKMMMEMMDGMDESED